MREKQIEEIGKIICGMENGCDGCMWNKARCNERNYAEEIYKAGYHKQSEGMWISNDLGGYKWAYYCSECGWIDGYPFNDRHKYCPNCGAKMKGGE